MSAKEELIAAALTAVDELHDINQVVPIHDRIENQLREACARAMGQKAPDMVEVEKRLVSLLVRHERIVEGTLEHSSAEYKTARAALRGEVKP